MGRHISVHALMRQNYFPALATFPVLENKKVTFCCFCLWGHQPAPALSAGEQDRRWRMPPAALFFGFLRLGALAGASSTRCRAWPEPACTAASLSAAQGGQLHGKRSAP